MKNKKSVHRYKHIFRHAYSKQFYKVLIRFLGLEINIVRSDLVGPEPNQNKQKL